MRIQEILCKSRAHKERFAFSNEFLTRGDTHDRDERTGSAKRVNRLRRVDEWKFFGSKVNCGKEEEGRRRRKDATSLNILSCLVHISVSGQIS